MLATYVRRMRNNNLEIRIAGFSCRPQKHMWVPLGLSRSLVCNNPCRSVSSRGKVLEGRKKEGIAITSANEMRFSLRYLYKRLRFLGNKLISHFITLAFVALWHGIAPGFFLCFIGEFVIIVVEQQVAIKMMQIYRMFLYNQNFFRILSQKFAFSPKRLRDIRNSCIKWMTL